MKFFENFIKQEEIKFRKEVRISKKSFDVLFFLILLKTTISLSLEAGKHKDTPIFI